MIAIAFRWSGRRGHRLGVLVLLFVALMLVVPLAGLTVAQLYTPEVERDTYANLEAIAKLKAGQIENWLHERENNGLALMANETLARQISQMAQGRLDRQSRGEVQRYLDHVAAALAIRANAPGTTEGVDYRAMAVFSAYRPVAGTDWHLLAKLDPNEVFAALRTLVAWVTQ